jgi:hypothetical protein
MKVCPECQARSFSRPFPACRECGSPVCQHIGRGYDKESRTTLCQAGACRKAMNERFKKETTR